jgi:hypothetical protein
MLSTGTATYKRSMQADVMESSLLAVQVNVTGCMPRT